jgi:hypothetical protein
MSKSAKSTTPVLSPLAQIIEDRADDRAEMIAAECSVLTSEQITEYDRKARARLDSDTGEVNAACIIDTYGERLNVGRICDEIVRSAYPDSVSKSGKVTPHARTKAVMVASVAMMRALEGLSAEDAALVRTIILCEARNLALALNDAKGAITERAPLAGALLSVK